MQPVQLKRTSLMLPKVAIWHPCSKVIWNNKYRKTSWFLYLLILYKSFVISLGSQRSENVYLRLMHFLMEIYIIIEMLLSTIAKNNYAIFREAHIKFPCETSFRELLIHGKCFNVLCPISLLVPGTHVPLNKGTREQENYSTVDEWTIKVSVKHTHILISVLCICRRSDLCASSMIRKNFYETLSRRNLLTHDTKVEFSYIKKRNVYLHGEINGNLWASWKLLNNIL